VLQSLCKWLEEECRCSAAAGLPLWLSQCSAAIGVGNTASFTVNNGRAEENSYMGIGMSIYILLL